MRHAPLAAWHRNCPLMPRKPKAAHPASPQPARNLPGLLLSFIHRSAWKEYSPKFVCRILHNTGPMRTLRHIPDVGKHTRQPYMLWWRIKMRGCE
jgi:hypothetical protein